MRSKTVGIDLDRSTPIGEFPLPSGEGRRVLTITPGGQVNFTAHTRNEDDTVEDHTETFHLDTDEGFTRFVELLTESAMRAKAREIKNVLYTR